MRDATSRRLDTLAQITRCEVTEVQQLCKNFGGLTGQSRRSRCWRMDPTSASRSYTPLNTKGKASNPYGSTSFPPRLQQPTKTPQSMPCSVS